MMEADMEVDLEADMDMDKEVDVDLEEENLNEEAEVPLAGVCGSNVDKPSPPPPVIPIVNSSIVIGGPAPAGIGRG